MVGEKNEFAYSEGPPDNSREHEKQPGVELYLVSDLHGLSQRELDQLLGKLRNVAQEGGKKEENKKRRFTVLMGDLPASEREDSYIREFKAARGDKSKLRFDHPGQEEIFDDIVRKRGWRAGAYRAAKLNTPTELKIARRGAVERNKSIAEKLHDLPYPIVYTGNAETNSPYGGVDEAYKEQKISYFTNPELIDLGERALIIWPSQKDPKSLSDEERDSFNELMEKSMRRLLKESEGKKEIIILSHEQLFHGSRKYEERVKETGSVPYGSPHRGVNPSGKYIRKLISSLPKETRIALVFGHMHDPQNVMLQGTGFKFEETESGGLGRLYISSKPDGGDEKNIRSVELFYIPHNTVGVLQAGGEGFKFKKVDT